MVNAPTIQRLLFVEVLGALRRLFVGLVVLAVYVVLEGGLSGTIPWAVFGIGLVLGFGSEIDHLLKPAWRKEIPSPPRESQESSWWQILTRWWWFGVFSLGGFGLLAIVVPESLVFLAGAMLGVVPALLCLAAQLSAHERRTGSLVYLHTGKGLDPASYYAKTVPRRSL